MKELTVGPGEYLFKAGQFDNRFFILISGKIDLIIEKNQTTEYTIQIIRQNNEIFGLKEFLAEQPRACSAKSTEITSLMYCNREEFI